MDTKTMLTEASPTAVDTTEPVAGVSAARPKIHHFTFHGRASRVGLAAFAATKVLLESAIKAAPGETDGKAARAALKVGPMRWQCVVRFMTDGRIATCRDAIEMGSASLLGSMSVREFHTGDLAEFPDIGGAGTRFVVKARAPGKRDGNMPVGADYVGSPQRRTFDFTVVNRSLTHCVWTG
jgi:hypothetical protein